MPVNHEWVDRSSKRETNIGLMLGQRRRRWATFTPALSNVLHVLEGRCIPPDPYLKGAYITTGDPWCGDAPSDSAVSGSYETQKWWQCWLKVAPTSSTLAQHWPSVEPISRLSRDSVVVPTKLCSPSGTRDGQASRWCYRQSLRSQWVWIALYEVIITKIDRACIILCNGQTQPL